MKRAIKIFGQTHSDSYRRRDENFYGETEFDEAKIK